MAKSHNLGFPRIGPKREVKKLVEAYWKETLSEEGLAEGCAEIRKNNLNAQKSLSLVPVGDFALYDHVLGHSAMFGAVPSRFGDCSGEKELTTYFRMARGRAPGGEDTRALEMTKWFDTNYHYLVPELEGGTKLSLHPGRFLDEVREAASLLGKERVKPVLIGPVTWLWLAKAEGGDRAENLKFLDALLPLYRELLSELTEIGVGWVQMDEPILVTDLSPPWRDALQKSYREFSSHKAESGLRLLLSTYFGSVGDNAALLGELPVDGIHLDCVRGSDPLETFIKPGRVLSLGVIDGRNIWRSDLGALLDRLEPVHEQLKDDLWIAPSCSLLHTPVDLAGEKKLPQEIKSWMAFAVQKIGEITVLSTALNEGREKVSEALAENEKIIRARGASPLSKNEAVRGRVKGIDAKMSRRTSPYAQRNALQRDKLQLPKFPTTTIGSFPQTAEIRKARREHKNGKMDKDKYQSFIQEQIRNAIAVQKELEIDVFVHGEAERNDMVEYFGELLDGFAFSENGWVQSYGSRCVKPPIIYGDISRPAPMTVEWIRYAQELTDKPVKGMLTGPVTILAWSFPRDDLSREDICRQIALALRDEVSDLEKAGVGIIQIDEPAFRETLPLRKAEWANYLRWATECFRLSACSVGDATQIHTHMCYSEFNDIIEAIAEMDADVFSIETARSNMELLGAFHEFTYPNEIGTGVYDIHSPLVPEVGEIRRLMEKAAELIPAERLWVNPDCGLKTRAWPETKKALANMVQAAQGLRNA